MTSSKWQWPTETQVLDGIEEVIQAPLSNVCLPRNSYINRVFEVTRADTKEPYIAKWYRPQRWTPDMILEEHAVLKGLYDQEIPVIPPLEFKEKTLFFDDIFPFALFPKKGGRMMDEMHQSQWEEVGRLLGRVHQYTHTLTDSSRVVWRPGIATKQHYEILVNQQVIPLQYHDTFETAVTRFIQSTDPLFDETPMMVLHGDCHAGNIIFRPNESHYLVDFDDMVVGPPIQDCWMLLPGHPHAYPQEMNWFLNGYEVFADVDQLKTSLVLPLRIMRQIHFASWCAIQHQDVAFKYHFPQWGDMAYWNTLIKDILHWQEEQ